MVPSATNRILEILEMIENGQLDAESVLLASLKYMSEDDVADMAHLNEFFFDEYIDFEGDEE